MAWKIDVVVVGPIQCNCYIFRDDVSGKAYLIDPGAESNELLAYIEKRKLQIQAILITHAHVDHVGGIESVHALSKAPVLYHSGDRFLYEDLKMQAQFFGTTPTQLMATQPTVGDDSLTDQQELNFQQGKIRVLHTPGHTPGSVCFHASGEEDLVFTGDTLFAGSIGRTDLWGGNYEQIIDSIQTKLMALPDSALVLPGHGSETTIAEERYSNPFLNRRSRS